MHLHKGHKAQPHVAAASPPARPPALVLRALGEGEGAVPRPGPQAQARVQPQEPPQEPPPAAECQSGGASAVFARGRPLMPEQLLPSFEALLAQAALPAGTEALPAGTEAP